VTAVDVDVLRVSVDPAGRFGNPLGVIGWATVGGRVAHETTRKLNIP
jgi:hypothetical protein